MSVPRVGVAAIIVNAEGKVLIGLRKGSHGAGTWQLPGGHLEFGESPVECATRETLEETDLAVTGSRIVSVTNDVFTKENKHYITLFVWCELAREGQEAKVMEPNKCEGWHWKTWDEVRAIKGTSEPGEVLFLPLHALIDKTSSLDELRPETAELQS